MNPKAHIKHFRQNYFITNQIFVRQATISILLLISHTSRCATCKLLLSSSVTTPRRTFTTEHRMSVIHTKNRSAFAERSYEFRQLSTFPGSHPPSIIDVKELNFCVRHGNRWFLLAIVTGFLFLRVLALSKLNNVSSYDSFLSNSYLFA